MENAQARNLIRKVVNTSATIENKPEEITVSLGTCANNLLLIAAGFAEKCQPIPWLGDRCLGIRFLWKTTRHLHRLGNEAVMDWPVKLRDSLRLQPPSGMAEAGCGWLGQRNGNASRS